MTAAPNARPGKDAMDMDRKLALSFGLMALLLILTAVVAAGYLFSRAQAREEDRLSGLLASILSETISRVSFSGKHHARLLVRDLVARAPEVVAISVETPDGRVLAHSDPALDDTEVSPQNAAVSRLALEKDAPVPVSLTGPKGRMREVVAPYRSGYDGKVLGVVRVDILAEKTRNDLTANLITLLSLAAVLAAAAMAGVFLLSRRFGAEVRDLARQLRGVLDHAPLAIAISDRRGRVQAGSAAFVELFGEPAPDQAMADLLALRLSEDAAQAFRELHERAEAGAEKAEREMSVELRGDRLFLHASVFPTAWEASGQATLFCSVISDVTEARQAEIAVRESEARYRGLFETANDGIVILDGDAIIETNRKASVLFDAPDGALEGLRVPDVSPERQPDGRPSAEKALEYVRETLDGQTRVFEWRHTSLTGREFDAEVALNPVVIGGGTRLQAIVRDVTARKENEERLRQSEEKFSTIFEMAPECLLITRLRDGKVVSVNGAFETLTGYSREDVLGRQSADLGLWAPAGKREEYLALLKAKQRVDQFEFDMRTKDGSIRRCLVSGQMITLDGEPCALSVIRDLTAAARMQELMIQTEKMLSVGGLAAGMAHELNNPLGIIIQSVQNIERRLSPGLKGNQEAAAALGLDFGAMTAYLERRGPTGYLQAIFKAGERAARIIRSMLDFSRTKESAWTACQLNDLLDQALELAGNDYDLRRKYDFKTARVVRRYAKDMPAAACKETEVVQVFLNIIKNAAQAMAEREAPPEPPTLTLETSYDESVARAVIADNGPGMTEEIRRRIFNPFFTTKGPREGTGLGLSVSFFIIQQKLKGRMFVESAPGHGARFTIELPRFDAPASPGEPPEPGSSAP